MSKFPDKIYLSIIPEQFGDRENDIYEEWSLAPIKGVENQEYLALTIEDIKTIVDIYDDCLNITFEKDKPAYESEEFYEEVLRRFRETKNK